jgi:signal peptidase I
LPKKSNGSVKEVVKLAVLIAIVVGSVLAVDLGLQIAMNTSTPVVVVTSGSMSPTLERGDICIIQKVASDQYVVGNHNNRTGDIIVFDATGIYPGPDPVIHRIINRTYDQVTNHTWFLTQGDNNPYADNLGHGAFPGGWVEDTRVYGKVISTIPWIGNIFLFLREGGVWLVVMVLAIIIIAVIVQETSKVERKFKETVHSNST